MAFFARKPKHGEGLKKVYYDIIGCVQLNDLDGVISVLSDNPEQVQKVDSRGMNALHWAVFRNNIEIAKTLIDFCYYDDKNQRQTIDADLKDMFGRKPIEIAVRKGNEDMIQLISKVIFPEMFDPNSEWNSDEPAKKIIEFPKPEPE